MKKIMLSLGIVAVCALLVIGASVAFFSDSEESIGHTFTAETFEIAVDGQNPWTKVLQWGSILPGDRKEISLVITNIGQNPAKVWQIINDVATSENILSEPEQQWYDDYNSGQAKNDLDSAIICEMLVDGQLVIAEEAGVTLDQIKEYYLGLRKLDIGAEPAQYGILNPGESITVVQRYFFEPTTANWAQSDKIVFSLEILAQQVNVGIPEPIKQLAVLDNKLVTGNWTAIADEILGLLKYDSQAPVFNYDFYGLGLNQSKEYCLIYYADGWPGNHPGALIASGWPDENSHLALAEAKDIGMDLPHPDDTNYPFGAKIWLVPCDHYNKNTLAISWPPDNTNWLFENWPGLINYTQGPTPAPTEQSATIYLDQLGNDLDAQYGYQHGYQSLATVAFSYLTPAQGKLSGTITASGLKPFATYQVKLAGQPTCADASGDDLANERIGYKGRWTCLDCNGSPSGNNRSDTEYALNKVKPDADPTKECIAGYLIFDYFTADANGSASQFVETVNSYHVLWCDGAICQPDKNNSDLDYLDSDHDLDSPPAVKFCPSAKVNGELERFTCGGLTLDPGSYDLIMSLTEECFHQGSNWATVLQGRIKFEIN